ncbi:MAG: PAS domain S-box protein, partial [Leptolyngbyaceae bacterium]|nr:PAS domain S-box protein [Leptolyngbyaceae bacterium]
QAQIQQQETAQALQKLNQTLEAKVAERTLALQERESRYRALIEVMPDLMIRIHADGTYLDVVLGQETLPFNPEQFRPGVNIYDVTPADHARTRMEYVHRALDTHIVQFYEYELDIQGKIMIEEARIIAINAEEALVIARDITERKRTENQLRQSEQRFRQAIASAPFPIMIHAEDGEVLQINEVWTELTGYTHADMPTTQVWAERAYGDRATEVLETIINPKYGINHRHDAVELTVTTRDGQARIWHVSSTHLGQLADGRHLVMSMAADITQHRQAELALQASETRWQFALEGSGDGIWDWNAQTNTVFFSRQWKTMLGFTDAEIGTDLQEWDSRMHPDDRDQCYADLNRHFRGETPVYQNEHRLRCKDGSYKWILDRGKVVEWFDDGQPLRVIGTHTDISDRKRAEAQLQNLIAGTAATTGHDFFPVLVQHLAEALEVAYAVIAALDDSQLHPLAFWGRGDLHLVCSYETHQTPCDRSLQEGMYHCESGVQQAFPLDHDLVFLNADSYFGIALHNSQGELIGNLCILDVQPIRSPQRAKQILQVFAARAAAEMERQRARTDLEKLNQALESKVIERTAKLLERETRYRGLMEGAGDGILVCDRHGKVLEVNHKAVELLGYGRDELEGMSFQDLCPPGDCSAMMTQFDQIAAQPSFHGEDSQFVAKGGRCIPVDISTSVLEIQEKLIIQAIFRDISDRKRAEAILQQTNAELMRATRLKDEFLANMSHELRTPLNAILGMTEGLQDGVFGPLNPKQIEALQTVERGGQHLLQLINDVLDVAKIEAGHMALDLAPTAIAPLCRSSLNFVKQQALKKRIQIDTHLPSHLPDVNLDERRIRQVLINLLNNAVKFTPEGGRITLAVRLEKTENRRPKAEEFPTLHIAITDTGIGIAPDHLNRLFQPFVQIDGALNRQYTGTGLGLALVKRIVELHRGTVTLRSEVGVGSCFTLSLPYDETIPLLRIQTATPELVEQPAAPDQIAPTILIVEDNDANVRTMSSYLQARGYHIHVAYNGQDALNFLQKHQPDLILMDIQMPEMDGLEAIQYIRHHQATANIPIIALTALAMEGDRDRCLAAGANEYLSKPVKLRLLASTIQQHLLHGNERTDHHNEPR